jgi:hypothetical protein
MSACLLACLLACLFAHVCRFKYWDRDGSNALSKVEVLRALIKTFRRRDGSVEVASMRDTLDAVWGLFDTDGGGTVDLDEFTQSDGLCDTILASIPMPSPRAAAAHARPVVRDEPVEEAMGAMEIPSR